MIPTVAEISAQPNIAGRCRAELDSPSLTVISFPFSRALTQEMSAVLKNITTK